MSYPSGTGRLPDAYLNPVSSSFVEFLAAAAPDLLPQNSDGGTLRPGDFAPHGTTIVTAVHATGVVMAGDRRATMGNVIAQRDIEKVFPADDLSVVGIAGTAGVAIELVRLFQVELEHYEKIEGASLSLDGKANRLATMIRGNLGMAMQGLVVVPLFAGYDERKQAGRIFTYDVTGGRYEETGGYTAVGSGSVYAKSALKKRYSEGLPAEDVIRLCVEALYDAADDDSATGGPDLTRKIFPVVVNVDPAGVRVLNEDEVAGVAQAVVDARMTNPGG